MSVAAAAKPVARRRITSWLLGVGVVTFLAGLLFGSEQGVISGALPMQTPWAIGGDMMTSERTG